MRKAMARLRTTSKRMWFNLAASRTQDAELRSRAAGSRDQLTEQMTPDQINQAQQRAHEWTPK